MRLVIQRVSRGEVRVDGQVIGRIGNGLVVLLGIRTGDGPEHVSWCAKKLVTLRIFQDDEGKMNRSLLDCGGAALIVSQFTLYGDAVKGNRPSFMDAARPEIAEPLYEAFCAEVAALNVQVERGIFGAMMEVDLVNDGPVTILLER